MCSYFFLCIGVVYPMQSRTRPRRNLWAYLLPVLVLAISFNVPKFLELGPSQKISEVRWIYKLFWITHPTSRQLDALSKRDEIPCHGRTETDVNKITVHKHFSVSALCSKKMQTVFFLQKKNKIKKKFKWLAEELGKLSQTYKLTVSYTTPAFLQRVLASTLIYKYQYLEEKNLVAQYLPMPSQLDNSYPIVWTWSTF